MNRKCIWCGEEKPTAAFRAGRNYCYACHLKRNREYTRKWQARNAKRHRAAVAKYDAQNKLQATARWKVTKALRSGLLARKPCAVCGSPATEAHHDDYSKPLDVRWLCKAHHEQTHHGEAD